MNIYKRNGELEKYNGKKIKTAVESSFSSVNEKITDQELSEIEKEIRQILEENEEHRSVENIQNLVELALIKRTHHSALRSFILYRESRAKKRHIRDLITNEIKSFSISSILKKIEKKYSNNDDKYTLKILYEKYKTFLKENSNDEEKLQMLINAACESTSQESPDWEYVAASFLMKKFLLRLEKTLESKDITSFYDKLVFMINEGLYGDYIIKNYSREDIDYFESFLNYDRDELLTYSSLRLIISRYVIKTKDNNPIETPQEMFMGIAMHLGMQENENTRRDFVINLYDILSLLKVTVATPTMSNARKPYHQLSSCFVDTVPDSLDGIYRSITNFAKVSKMGGGMGLYFGKVRATGSDIRGFKGAAGGVLRWIKLVNDTAVAVDQLGVRQGAVAVYLDAWHKDLPEFLQIKTTNGDDRMKAHDIFPGICFPDLFWRLVRDDRDSNWYFMCPHEIKNIMGFNLEDFYGEEWEQKYYQCINEQKLSKRIMPIREVLRLFIKSIVETGAPFVFNRDIVNKYNTNPQTGMIYCSNLCTEIAQSMSEIKDYKIKTEDKNGDTVIIEETRAGNFVVCNLASLVLGNIDVNNDKEIEYVVSTIVRALDNVIDLNYYPLPYAKITNHQFRSIGLGVSGYHHMLAKEGIKWESEEHINFVDKLFEKINYFAIKTSSQLAKEKGKYKKYYGSDWQTGKYFEKRNYNSEKWQQLKNEVMKEGIRNAYLLAVAPTSSTSIIAGTTAGIDPIMNRYFLEEKKGSIIPRVAPSLSLKTYWLYKNAHLIDQKYSIKACAIRQKHIDQAQSMNLYITNDYKMSQVANLYIYAWELGVKTIYYSRSKSLEVEECEACSS